MPDEKPEKIEANPTPEDLTADELEQVAGGLTATTTTTTSIKWEGPEFDAFKMK
jgi:hypothetical protein